MRLIKPILPIILFFILLSAAVFLLRSKPDSQTPATLQLNQSNTTAGTSSQTSDVSPSTSDVDFAAIQGPQKPPPLKIQQIAPVKYAMRSLQQDVIEIGTERHSPPKPYLKLNKWEGEAMLKVSIPYNTDETPQELDGKLRYQGDGVKIDFYPKTPQEITQKDSQGNEHKFTINEEGGVEFDTILDEKPSTNQIVFPIETQNLDFFYQPPLNEENKNPNLTCTETTCIDKDGQVVNFRPENVVGSYAVYHQSKQGDYSQMGGKNYKTGKAFHIYRPKVTDAQGNEIWGELKIDEQNNTLTITIDQKWLDEAVYPVTIDPNFGYETAGSSNGSALVNNWYGSLFPSPSDAGTATSITSYGRSVLGNAYFKGVVVKHSDLTIITNGIGSAVSPTADGWYTSTFGTAPTLATSTDYVLSIVAGNAGSGYYRIYYDGGDTNQGHYETDNNYSSPTNPSSITHDNNKYSIYATYTVPSIKFNGLKMEGIKIQ